MPKLDAPASAEGRLADDRPALGFIGREELERLVREEHRKLALRSASRPRRALSRAAFAGLVVAVSWLAYAEFFSRPI